MIKKLHHRLRHLWHLIRDVSGDSAYEQYLKHYAEFHANSVNAPAMLNKKEFFKMWQDSQWKGVKRCC